MRCFWSILMTTSLLVAACYGSAARPPAAWVGEDWQYRQVVVKELSSPTLKLDFGSAEIDTQGNVQPDGADIRVTDIWNNMVPYQVASVSKDGHVRVEFKLVGSAGETAYCIYYGNPAAKPLIYSLGTPSRGGLYLTVKAYESGKVNSIEMFMELFNSAKRTIGEGIRQDINDKSNPFSEEYERCLALYSGVIRVPWDGTYGFQLKATGPAFVTIDGKTVLSQQLAKGRFTSADGIQLTRGDHFAQFHLFSRHPSSYIAELYWRTPGERHFKIIGPESFSSTFSFTPVARQRFGQIANSFFSYAVEGKLRLIGTEDVLTAVRFKNLSTDMRGEFLSAEWDFGDGNSSRESCPTHVYRRTGDFTVSLTAVDDMGFKDTCSAALNIDRAGAEKIEVQWDLQEDSRLIDPDQDEIEARLAFHMYSLGEKEFSLTTVTTSGEEVIDEDSTPLKLASREPLITTTKLPNHEGSFTVTWSLSLSGIEIMRRELRAIEDTDRFPKVSAHDASILDSEGRHVVVKLTGSPNTEKRKLADVFDEKKDKSITIAAIDNSLCNTGEGYDESKFYYRKLKALLEEEYPGVAAEIHRFAVKRDQLGYFPISRIVSASAEICSLDPDVILISCDQQDLFNFTPPEMLGRYFTLMIHNYIANTRAKIVLVTPPPRPEKAHRSKIFATAISKMALIHNVGLADVYQAVSLYEGDWRTLFLDEEEPDGVYYLYMNSKGQDIIANILFNTIIQD